MTAEQAASIVIAYEPVWAIGTGEVATPDDAQEVCAAIRTLLAELYSGDVADGVRVLYGGCVKANNVAAIMAQEDVDGALVGGASIDPDEFASICRYRDHLARRAARRPDGSDGPSAVGLGQVLARARTCGVADRRRPPGPTIGVTTWMRFASCCRSCWCCPAWS